MKWFDRLTILIGVLFFGGWAVLGTVFYIKALIDFVAQII